MKIFKKMMVSIMALTVLLSSAQIYAKADNADISETKYDEAVSFFVDFGLISREEKDKFDSELGMSRAEFSMLLASILGYKSGDDLGESVFEDVPQDNPAKDAVKFLKSHNIVSGTSDSEFCPNDGMTYRLAARTVAVALGYRNVIREESDFMSIIAKMGISKGMPQNDDIIKRGDACLMIFRALTVPMVELNMSENEYLINKDKTPLSEFLDTRIYNGLVMQTDQFSLYGTTDIRENEIIIDYNKYICTLPQKNDLLGHAVKYYVRDNDDYKKIIAIYDDAEFFETIQYDDMMPSTNINSIEYYRGKKAVTKRTGNDTYFVYNGRGISKELTDEMIIPEYGNVQIMDNDGDGTVDVVFIKNYAVYQVSGAAGASDKIYFKNTDFFIDSDSVDIYLSRNGTKIDIADVKKDEVADVLISADGSFAAVEFCDNTAYGTVTAVDNTNNKITVGESEYKMYPFIEPISAGEMAEFYLDVFGSIAFWRKETEYKYAFLIKLYNDESEENTYARLFTDKGKDETIQLKTKVKLYEGEYSSTYLDSNTIENIFSDKQIIKYKLNQEGQISEIYKYTDKTPGDFGCDGFVRNVVSTGRCIYHPKGYFVDQYNPKEKSALVDADTVVFKLKDSESESKRQRLDVSEMTATQYFERMEAFDLSEFGVAKCVLVYETEYQNFQVVDPIVLVRNVYKTVNSDDEIVYCIDGISHIKGSEITVKCDSDLLSNKNAVAVKKNVNIASVQSGDIIQCCLDSDNKIISWRLLNINGDNTERAYYIFTNSESITGAEYSGLGYFGKIINSNDKYFIIDNQALPKKRAYKFIDTDNQTLLHFEGRSIEKMDKQEIYAGMNAYIYVQPESGYVFIVSYE